MLSNEKQYRKRVFRRDLLKDTCIILVSLVGLTLAWSLVYILPDFMRRVSIAIANIVSIPLLVIIYLCVVWFIRVKIWPVTMGFIDEVLLEDQDSAPFVYAKTLFTASDGQEHTLKVVLEAYGDYEEGCEPELQKLLEKHSSKYEKCRVPVFYSLRDPQKSIVILDDAEKVSDTDENAESED